MPAPEKAVPFFEYRAFGAYRYLLAVLVMLQHFSANAAPDNFAQTLLGYELGSLAVYAFFALSGFVIMEAADTIYQAKPVPFMANRMLRLYPHFLLALLLSMLFHYVLIANGMLRIEHKIVVYDPQYFSLKNLFMNVLSIFPLVDKFIKINFVPIAWALRIEITFYLVIFAALFMSRKGMFKSYDLGFHSLCLTIVLVPFFVLSVLKLFPAMFGFLPYFSYGAGLYYITRGAKAAKLVVLLSVFGMCWHFLSLPPTHHEMGYQRYVLSQAVILFFMLAAIVLLLKVKVTDKAKKVDRELGNYTYPVYVYHYCVLIIVASFMDDYSWTTFITGLVLSIVISTLLTRLLDSRINRLRNSIRGITL